MRLIYFLSYSLILLQSFSATAQNDCYQVVHIGTETGTDPDSEIAKRYDNREMKAHYADLIVANNDFVLTFEGSGMYIIAGAEEINFRSVMLFESESSRYFEKKNRKTNPPFKFSRLDYPNKEDIDLIETGKTKIINNKLCHEFIIEKPVRITYFVDKELPFINYRPFPIKTPGFIVSSTSPIFGSNHNVTITKQLINIKGDNKYFKYIDEFERQFPPMGLFTKENVSHTNKIPTYIKEYSNEVYLNNYYYERDIKELRSNKSLHLKHKILRSDFSTYKALYFDNSQREILRIKEKNDNLIKDTNRIPEIVGDSILNEFDSSGKLSKELIIHNYNQTREYNYIGLASKSLIRVNKQQQPVSVISHNDKGEVQYKNTYSYDEKHQLRSYTEHKSDRTWSYDYHQNGLLSEMKKNGDTTNFEYIYKPGIETDTLFQKELISSRFTISTKIIVFNKLGQILLDKKDGPYNYYKQFFYGYNEKNRLPKTLLELENQLRIKYLNDYGNTLVIKSERNETKKKIKILDSLYKYQYAFLDLIKLQIKKPRKNHVNWFPEFELNEIELFHEDNNFEYYKAYYRETINFAINKAELDYNQTLNTFQSKYGMEQVEARPNESTIVLDISTRYLIIKKDKTNNQWVLQL